MRLVADAAQPLLQLGGTPRATFHEGPARKKIQNAERTAAAGARGVAPRTFVGEGMTPYIAIHRNAGAEATGGQCEDERYQGLRVNKQNQCLASWR